MLREPVLEFNYLCVVAGHIFVCPLFESESDLKTHCSQACFDQIMEYIFHTSTGGNATIDAASVATAAAWQNGFFWNHCGWLMLLDGLLTAVILFEQNLSRARRGE